MSEHEFNSNLIVVPSDGGKDWNIREYERNNLVGTAYRDSWPSTGKRGYLPAKANAYCWAAAPEMYDALQMGDGVRDGPDILRTAAYYLEEEARGILPVTIALRAKADAEEAALRKARGEEG